MESSTKDRYQTIIRSLSLSGTRELDGITMEAWHHVDLTVDQDSFGLPQGPIPVTQKHGNANIKPQSLRPLGSYLNHRKEDGDMYREFLAKVVADFERGCASLQDPKIFHHVIEAACFLRARLMLAHTMDTRRIADQRMIQTASKLIQATWEFKQTNSNLLSTPDPTVPQTLVSQADLTQVQTFLLIPPPAEALIGGSEGFERIAIHHTAQPLTAGTSNDRAAIATATCLHTSFSGDQLVSGYPAQPAFDEQEGYSILPQGFPPQNAPDSQFPIGTQPYTGPYIYPNHSFQSQRLASSCQADNLLSGFYGDIPLTESIRWDMDPHIQPAPAPPNMLQTREQDVQSVDTGARIAPGISTHSRIPQYPSGLDVDPQTQSTPAPFSPPQTLLHKVRSSDKEIRTAPEISPHARKAQTPAALANQPPNRSAVHRKARVRKRAPKPKLVPLMMADAPKERVGAGKERVGDVFVDESPVFATASPRKRTRVASTEGDEVEVVRTPVSYMFHTVDPGGIEGKSREAIMMEGRP